jgi:hypothetical protein
MGIVVSPHGQANNEIKPGDACGGFHDTNPFFRPKLQANLRALTGL